MVTALVPVDGPQRAFAAVKHAIQRARENDPPEIHWLPVQPVLARYLQAFVSRMSVKDYRLEAAQKAFRPACRLLSRENIPCAKHGFVGDVATVIANVQTSFAVTRLSWEHRATGSWRTG